MSAYRVRPAALSGRLRMPGDKSISQRIALLCALAEGESVIDGYLDGEDAHSTLQAAWKHWVRVVGSMIRTDFTFKAWRVS